MKRPKKVKRTQPTAQEQDLYARLTAVLSATQTDQERYQEQLTLVTTLTEQRDSALRALNDRANVEHFTKSILALSTELKRAIGELDTAVRIVKQFLRAPGGIGDES